MTGLSPAIRVAVIGAGAMGSGIAHVAARAGHTVYLFDKDAEAVARGIAAIGRDLRFLADKGKMEGTEAAAVLERVVPVDRLDDLADAGLVVEAVAENLSVKQELFRGVEEIVPQEAILATNTSSLSITAIGAALSRARRLAGLHFFNPAPRMALVEVVSGLATDPRVAATLYDTAAAWGKIPVRARSTPGFIVNRVARPFYAEALRVLGERAANPETLDAVLRDACGFRMGPFELMDLIGHDVNFAVTRSVFDAHYGDKRFTPSLLQQELVQAGRLGRKSGRGFYDYRDGAPKPVPAVEPVAEATASLALHGDPGIAEPLVARFESAGIVVHRDGGEGPGRFVIRDACLMLSDGRTATRRAAEEGMPNLVLFDLARDYAATLRLALARADQCTAEAWLGVVGTLQAAGIEVSRLDDVAGLIGLRTVSMLANEAADGVVEGIASAQDIDAAMRHGTNYPEGPLAWGDRLGVAYVSRVLANLREHYGEERYRLSPLIQRAATAGTSLLQGNYIA